tara:strand:+ start:3412 stop:4206 length:795 start_codon:yes stop_codon:yes gene_type:complete
MAENLVRKKDKALNRKVKNRDIARIDELCRQLKTGTKREGYEAQAQILEYFDNYLEKYVNLFSGASLDLGNYDTRGFLGMFLTGRAKTPGNLSQQRAYIVRVMSRFTREDVKSEVTVVFLNVLAKYRVVEGVNALNPLTKIFRWRVKDWFNKIVKDPLFKVVEPKGSSNSTLTLQEFIDLNYFEEPNFDDLEARMDLGWVLKPNEKLYQSLSRYERYLLSLVYEQHLPMVRVAAKLQRDKDTIKRHLKAALRKLKDRITDAAET